MFSLNVCQRESTAWPGVTRTQNSCFLQMTPFYFLQEIFFFSSDILVGFVVECEATATTVPQSAGEFYFPPEEQHVAPSRL